MKTVILCGGLGTRISEETANKPKPMVPIGKDPILVHIMHIYAHYGFTDFILALGYRGEIIKKYFLDYFDINSDFVINLKTGDTEHWNCPATPWRVALIDTGANTMTGGRLLRLKDYIGNDTFMVTYGDGVSDVDLKEAIAFHRSHGRLCTVTAVKAPGRFGTLQMRASSVSSFKEKPGYGRINGGFFIFEPGIFSYLEDDSTVLEKSPLEALAKVGELMAYKHDGFWQCMDTLKDKQFLEESWVKNEAPWKMWND